MHLVLHPSRAHPPISPRPAPACVRLCFRVMLQVSAVTPSINAPFAIVNRRSPPHRLGPVARPPIALGTPSRSDPHRSDSHRARTVPSRSDSHRADSHRSDPHQSLLPSLASPSLASPIARLPIARLPQSLGPPSLGPPSLGPPSLRPPSLRPARCTGAPHCCLLGPCRSDSIAQTLPLGPYRSCLVCACVCLSATETLLCDRTNAVVFLRTCVQSLPTLLIVGCTMHGACCNSN